METITKPTRPIVSYFGGKWRIADWIVEHLPNHRIYVEPFGGAASVLMRKPPATVDVYNDLSEEMVNLFRVVRDRQQCQELQYQLENTPYSRAEWMACHEWSDNPIEQARRTIVLGFMSCNAGKAQRRQSNGFKSHSSKHTHVGSFRSHTTALQIISNRLRHVIIECRDAIKVMNQHDGPDTLHYVDPPYLKEERKCKQPMYTQELMDVDEHQAIAESVRKLEGYVVVSHYPSSHYKDWYESFGWTAISKQAQDGSGSKGKSLRTEVLYLNPRAAEAQRQMRMF